MAETEKSERTLAVFFDFENLALGLKDKKEGHFDIQKVLERLVEKGKIVEGLFRLEPLFGLQTGIPCGRRGVDRNPEEGDDG